MALQVVAGAMLQCSFGMSPMPMVVLPLNRVMVGTPAATIMDHIPVVNIPPFGMCDSPANPMVIAATAAALGVPTPMPCIPVTAAPWIPGAPTVMIGVFPALDNASTCLCEWGGVIAVMEPGQFTTTVE